MRKILFTFLVLFYYVDPLYSEDIKIQELIADSLYVLGMEEYANKSYQKAIIHFNQVTQINERINRKEPFFSSNATHWEASSLYHLGDTLSAYKLSSEFMLAPVDQRLTTASDSLWLLSENALKQENYDLSILMAKKAIDYEIAILGSNHYYVANSYASLSDIYIEIGEIEKAKTYLSMSANIFKNIGYPLTYNCICVINNYSDLSFQTHDNNSSIIYLNEILDVINNNKLERNSREHAILLHNLSRIYYNNNEYHLAIEKGEKSITLLGNDSLDYSLKGGLYSLLSNCYCYEGNNSRGMECEILSYQNFKNAKIEDERIPQSLYKILTIGYIDDDLDSLSYYNQLIIDYCSKNFKDKTNHFYLDIAIIIRPILIMKIDGIEIKSYFDEAIEVFKNNVYDTYDYVFWGVELSKACEECSNYTSCIDILDFLCRHYENDNLSSFEQYGIVLEELANLYNSIYDYDKAIAYGEKALEIIGKYRDEREQAIIKQNLAFFHYRKGNFEMAYTLSLDAIEYIRNIDDTELLISNLLDLSEMLYDVGKYKNALQHALEALELSERRNDQGKIVHSLQNISACYYELNEYDLCYEYLMKALNINPNHTLLNNNAALFFYLNKEYEKTSIYNDISFSSIKTSVINSLSKFPIRQWIPYWEQERKILSNIVHYINVPNNTIPLLNETAYNSLLLSKGFLVNNYCHIKNMINQSYNNFNKQLWSNYINEKQVATNGGYLSNQMVDSIENVLIDVYKNELKFETISWKDVQSKLKKNDVAIEFFVNNNYKDPLYGALIIKKELDSPLYVRVCTESQIGAFLDSLNYDIYNSIEFGNLVWNKIILDSKIEQSDNIFFSPDGLLNTIAIEYSLIKKDLRIGDFYNIRRISSTRYISDFSNQDSIIIDSPVVLFGGLNYDCIAQNDNNYSFDSLTKKTNDNIRDKFNYLPYSRIEVDSIEHIAKQFNVEVVKFVDVKGTEKAFYESLYKKPSIIHLSTHGYYNLHNKKSNKIGAFLVPQIKNDNDNMELSLKNSGLLFSYAFDNKKKSILYSNDSPYNENDNVLTALELCDLDMSYSDLIVMSACETALGDITPDGIAGLQRGLKYAGARSIIMSLWKVDDMATSIMMTEFYKILFQTKSKHVALKHAQQKVKKIYDNPYYWASFILLD